VDSQLLHVFLIQCMAVKRGDTFVEGIDVIIRRDLDKHKALLNMNNINIQNFEAARNSEIGRKRFYGEQKGKRNYSDDAMDTAIRQMNTNIGKFERDIKLTKDQRELNTRIVDTLTVQLKAYDVGYKEMVDQLRKENAARS
jgi:hypothetical protein